MGHKSSKLDNHPSSFATAFTPAESNLVTEEERVKWKSYDYVIVGGGMRYQLLAVSHISLTIWHRDGGVCSCI